MGDEQHRQAELAIEIEQLLLHQHAGLRVERAERLVEQQCLGPVDQRARQADALAHAAAQLRRAMMLEARRGRPWR